jgi:ubiquinone/menaquinone biosynthesis C-methylase UbiE
MNGSLADRHKRWADTQLSYDSECGSYSRYTRSVIRKGHHLVIRLCEQMAHANPHPPVLLDVGCGGTDFYRKLHHVLGTYIGIEPSQSELLHADSKENVYLMRGMGEKILLPDSSVDIALLISVLDHCLDAHKTLEETFRVLRPGGTAIILLENRGRISNDIRKLLRMKVGHGEEHLYYFAVDDVLKLISPYGRVSHFCSYGFLLGFNWISSFIPEKTVSCLEAAADGLLEPLFTNKGQHFLVSITKKGQGASAPLGFLCPHCGGSFSWGMARCQSCGKELKWMRKDILDTFVQEG